MMFPSTILAQKAEPEEIQKADLDLLAKINELQITMQNALVPIGMLYTQYPGMDSPSTLWPFGTWANVSSTFAGDFFRAEGGSASAFESGEQGHAFQGHWHKFRKYSAAATGVGWTTNYAAYSDSTGSGIGSGTGDLDNLVSVQAPYTDGVNGTPQTAAETRPVNRTVRIWKRTA